MRNPEDTKYVWDKQNFSIIKKALRNNSIGNMTNEQINIAIAEADEEIKINIAIAEACGFTDIMWPMGFHQKMSDKRSKQYGGKWNFEIPNYCNDLNAMHEAEKYIMNESSILYKEELEKVSCIWHSTAKQKAIAFLKAIGKWEEGKND